MKKIRNWLLSVLLPAVIIPVGLMFAKYEFIDAPARKPDLEYKVFHGIHAQTDTSIEYVTYVHVENTGKGESLDDRAYVLVKFYGLILRFSEPWLLPIGSRFVDENNREIESCRDQAICKLVLGNLVSQGQISIGFISNNTLVDLPQVRYGGLLIKPSHCQGIRSPLALSCEVVS